MPNRSSITRDASILPLEERQSSWPETFTYDGKQWAAVRAYIDLRKEGYGQLLSQVYAGPSNEALLVENAPLPALIDDDARYACASALDLECRWARKPDNGWPESFIYDGDEWFVQFAVRNLLRETCDSSYGGLVHIVYANAMNEALDVLNA